MEHFLRAANAAQGAADAATKLFNELQVVQKSKGAYHEWKTDEPFPYEALPTPTSIRLLKLEPSKAMQKAAKTGKVLSGDAHNDDDDVRFIMRTVELDRNPRFTALSYTWRRQRSQVTAWRRWAYHFFMELVQDRPADYSLPDPDDELRATRKVTCNGYEMMVFENLFEALKQLRRGRPGEWLWIDAVCMNQSDSTELTAQIQIMGRIYQSAQLVVVWLGPFPAIAEEGLKTLEGIVQSGEPLVANPIFATRVGNGAAEDWRIESAALTAFHLAFRSYFKRVWVVQELCLAREVIYLHGKHEISFATLLTSCKWCVDKGSGRDMVDLKTMESLLPPHFTTHMRFLPTTLDARKEFAKGNKWTLIQWFHACNGRLASVGKDYVFAGLSLVRQSCLDIDQHLQATESGPPPLPRRPVGGQESGETNAAAGLSSRFSAPAPAANQSLTPRGLWPKLAPDYSASDAEVFVNAAACLLSHASLEDFLRLAARLRDQHQFRAVDSLRPRDLEAFSGLPSWTPAIGSWMSCLTMDLVPPDAQSPFKVSMVPHETDAHTADVSPSTSVSISADGRTLSLTAAVFERVSAYVYEKDPPQGFAELRKLLRFLDQPSDLYATNQDSSLQQVLAQRQGENAAKSQATPCLLEAVACAMVAGHVHGQKVTPSQAGTWLCENIESKVQQVVAETQRSVSDNQQIKQTLEAKAQKRGQSIEYLKTAEDDENAKKWRICDEANKQGLEVVTEVTAELEALKIRYSHLQWLPAGTIAVVPREEDVERAKLERRNAKEKQLGELLEKRSIDTKSSSSIRDALDRGRAKAVEITDDLYDRLNTWALSVGGKFRRVMSDECRAFEDAFIETLTWRRLCLTAKGHVLLGPLWLEEGDAVMLLPGVSVPFIFALEKEDLKREKARIEERLSHVDSGDDEEVMWTAVKVPQEARLAEIEHRLQTIAERPGDRWVLIGEAYVEGIMQGEAAAGLEYGSIDVV
ncbi:heterokaryon incompatibility protein-domain-containing protein [Microdochium trichocladiopsis]|uniref:Heterokaryon incompatibility protein-domain-containing protein n=1 Tax=Microdochium trichocladiopsis TaxID=1682393 RepID=A0A9P9BMU2_9PEZI|nr:heterokaryon incompatibility protein-domain-containing protein [Microdochium trichocladiopsis]KAH7018152.1 heterokaryon incompatibility protein-domain-containing protein [Microdochium trichocladiopsis]